MSELGERRGRKKLPGEGGRGASTPGLLQVTVNTGSRTAAIIATNNSS